METIALSRRAALTLMASALLVPPAHATAAGAHQFRFPALTGGEIRLADYAGHPVLIVNTASLCGYVDQYGGLQALQDRYGQRGLTVIGVPSDDFNQELGSAKAVKEFCTVNFNISFPLTDISHVTGPKAHPFYRWAASVGGAKAVPGWNFHKLLVAPDGSLAASFGTGTGPEAGVLIRAIEALLPAA